MPNASNSKRARRTTSTKAPARTTGRQARLTLAQRADRHDLYQRAVQCVEAEIDFVDQTFKTLTGRTASRLREDFCGTANSSCEWVRRRTSNIAVGLDIDQPTLDWGRQYNLASLSPKQRARVDLRASSVLDPLPDLAGTMDAVLAMNFSYWLFTSRATMLEYFRRVREALADDGVFFLDFYGGADALRVLKERRKIPHASKGEPSLVGFNSPYTYIWDQKSYNPITGELVCAIHFVLPDGSRIKDAFTYQWRLWTLPEIRDVLADAGFARTTVYWEGDDGDGEGNGEFTASEVGEACQSWICYITAEKRPRGAR